MERVVTLDQGGGDQQLLLAIGAATLFAVTRAIAHHDPRLHAVVLLLDGAMALLATAALFTPRRQVVIDGAGIQVRARYLGLTRVRYYPVAEICHIGIVSRWDLDDGFIFSIQATLRDRAALPLLTGTVSEGRAKAQLAAIERVCPQRPRLACLRSGGAALARPAHPCSMAL